MDRDGDIWEDSGESQMRIVESSRRPHIVGHTMSENAVRRVWGPLREVDGPDDATDGDGDTSAVTSSARSHALSFARDMIRPGPDADPEATARALIRLARFILPGDAS